MDNGKWLFRLLNLVYWDDRGCLQISMNPISATNTEMEGLVNAVEEEEGVLNTF